MAASLTAILALLVAGGEGEARVTRTPDADAAGAARGPLSPDPPAAADPDADAIVVTGRRRGQADVGAETELNEDEIGAYGARSIGELLVDIAPLIDPKGDAPAVLVNGKRIGSPAEIADYPPEALTGIAILLPEAAARYGYPSGQRVVNLELKEKYASWDVNAGVTVPTAGGRRSVQLAAGRTAIDGDNRWNAQIALADDTALLKSARSLPVRDDLLALLPTLEGGGGIDPNRFESVTGAARSVDGNVGFNRPLGDLALALSANAATNSGTQLIGMPIGSVVLRPESSPAGSSLPGPGEATVRLTRLLGDRALQSRQQSDSFGASATVSGSVRGWQASLSLFYSHSRTDNIYDRGYDVSGVQRLIDAGDRSFDPYGPWPKTPLVSDRTRFRTDSLAATLNVSKALVQLPAGPLFGSATVNARRTWSIFTSASTDGVQPDRLNSNQIDGRWSLSIPVASRAQHGLAMLGDLGLDLSMEAGLATATRMRRKWDAAIRWSPFACLDLRATIGQEHAEPSFDLLYGPRIEVVTRLFDFAAQDYVQPIRIFGGNPDLTGGRIRTLALSAMIRPFGGDLATVNIAYRRQTSRGGIMPFPILTPDVEAAFPDRVTRDAGGRLVAIDSRPVNISQDRTRTLVSGLTLRYTERPRISGGGPSRPNGFRPWTLSLSVNHNWQLGSETVIRPDLPVLDRLRGSGQPRHTVALGLVIGRDGLGATVNGNWSSGARVRPQGTAGEAVEFRYAPSAVFNLGLFVEPERWIEGPDRQNRASPLRISLDIQNVLRGYRKVVVSDGPVPAGFGRDDIDPVGRTVRLSLRKQF